MYNHLHTTCEFIPKYLQFIYKLIYHHFIAFPSTSLIWYNIMIVDTMGNSPGLHPFPIFIQPMGSTSRRSNTPCASTALCNFLRRWSMGTKSSVAPGLTTRCFSTDGGYWWVPSGNLNHPWLEMVNIPPIKMVMTRWWFIVVLPSGNLLHSYWKWPSRNSGFTHWTWWFSIVFCMFTRG